METPSDLGHLDWVVPFVMQNDGVALRPTVQGQDESRRCFLEGCWRWGVRFLDEGQGLLCAPSSSKTQSPTWTR